MPPAAYYALTGTGLVALAYAFHWFRVSRLDAKHRRLEQELAERSRQLEAAQSRIEQLAIEDPLTGLLNRRCLEDRLEREWARAIRERAQVALVLIGVDEFGKLNDAYGPETGDERLRQVAAALRQAIHRPGDVAARYSGAKFALLLPGTMQAGAGLLADRLRRAVEALELPHGESPHQRVTLSCGVAAMWPHAGGAAADLIERARKALAQARQDGRNRVAEAPPEPTPEWSEPVSRRGAPRPAAG